MAGAIIDSQLSAGVSARVRFMLADERHDAAIRRLLRDNPIPGDIALTLEREPNYFIGSRLPGSRGEQTIIAFQGDRIVCMGGCSLRDRYINGASRRVGYLGGLRLDRSVQGRFDIVRRGYQFFEEIARDMSAEYYFTSVASDNLRFLCLLERGLPGMPRYQFLSEYVTLLAPISGQLAGAERVAQKAHRNLEGLGLKCSHGSKQNAGRLAEFLNGCSKQTQLATHWTEDALLQLDDFGLPLNDFQIVTDGEAIVAATALWDQRSFKQTVIRSYSQKLSFFRPWINGAGRLFGMPQLPKLDSVLAHAFISPCATDPRHHGLLPDLIRLCVPRAVARGIKFLTLGFGNEDRRIEIVRTAFRCREYRSRLYQVAWDREACGPQTLDARPISPEVALL